MRDTGKKPRNHVLAAGLFCGLCAGCMIPVYHQPQGFSSSYYRYLQQSMQAPPVLPPSALPSAVSETKPESQPAAETDDEFESEETTAAPSGSWWSWLNRPLTFRSGDESR